MNLPQPDENRWERQAVDGRGQAQATKILLLKRSDFKSLFLFIKVIVAAGKRKLPVEVAEAV